MCAPPVGRTVPNIAARLSGEKQVDFQAKPLRRTGGRVKGLGVFRPQHNFTLGSPSPCPLPPGERVSLARSPYAAHTAPSPLEGEGWGEGDWFTRRRGDAEGKPSPFPTPSPLPHPITPDLIRGLALCRAGGRKAEPRVRHGATGRGNPKKPFSYTNLFGYISCLFENRKGTFMTSRPRKTDAPAPSSTLDIPAGPPISMSKLLPGLRVRHDGWTQARTQRFLDTLAHTGCVTDAARVAGMSRMASKDCPAPPPSFKT